jgi:hypothetical protein
MILEPGDKVLVAHRRLFPEDQARFFSAEVASCEGALAELEGYAWVREPFMGQLVRKQDRRTKIVSLSSGTLFVYKLPREINMEALKSEPGIEGQVFLTDGGQFRMDLTERVGADR